MSITGFLKMTAIPALSAMPAFAEGDIAVGETVFGKCKACHAIVAGDETIIQKGGKIGPNLFAVIGRQAGTYPEFKYGDDLIAAGVAGLVWDETTFLDYVENPKEFLQEFLQSDTAKTRMTLKLAEGGADVLAYLISVAPVVTEFEGESEAEAEAETD